MSAFRVVAIATETAEKVRASLRSSFHDLPAYQEISTDDAPCRHCLGKFKAGEDRRILFTYDRFDGVESLPQPGPVYVHAAGCDRYSETAGFPEQLRNSPRTLEAYGAGRVLVAREHVIDGRFEPIIARMLGSREVDYIQVNSTTAGCFTFRIER
jgi:hypothetical protein